MHLPHLRRWFQFRLSSWFALVVILAWAMLQQPWLVAVPGPPLPNATPVVTHNPIGDGFLMYVVPRTEKRVPNPGLRWPAYALLAFFFWRGVALRDEIRETCES